MGFSSLHLPVVLGIECRSSGLLAGVVTRWAIYLSDLLSWTLIQHDGVLWSQTQERISPYYCLFLSIIIWMNSTYCPKGRGIVGNVNKYSQNIQENVLLLCTETTLSLPPPPSTPHLFGYGISLPYSGWPPIPRFKWSSNLCFSTCWDHSCVIPFSFGLVLGRWTTGISLLPQVQSGCNLFFSAGTKIQGLTFVRHALLWTTETTQRYGIFGFGFFFVVVIFFRCLLFYVYEHFAYMDISAPPHMQLVSVEMVSLRVSARSQVLYNKCS